MNQKNEKIKILTGTAHLFQYSFNEITMQIYLDSLAEISVEALRRVMTHGIKANLWQRMPLPGQILAELYQSEDTKTKLHGHQEFQKILKSCRSNGRNKIPDVENDSLQALRLSGGMERIAEASDEELHWIQKDFVEHFERVREKSKLESRQNLIGSGENQKYLSNIVDKLTERMSIK